MDTQPEHKEEPISQSMLEARTKKKRRLGWILLDILGILAIGAGIWLWQTRNTTTTPTQAVILEPALVFITPQGFVPSTLTVQKGQTVIWINNDAAPHQLTSSNQTNQIFSNEEPLQQNESFSYSFSESGTYSSQDPSNSSLNATIIVE